MTTGRNLSTMSWISAASAWSVSAVVAIHGVLDSCCSSDGKHGERKKPQMKSRIIAKMIPLMMLLRRLECVSSGWLMDNPFSSINNNIWYGDFQLMEAQCGLY